MATVKQILLVDDHFEMLEFLRSMLELSSHDYEVLAVPSAEEGWLELRRGSFDLLITDVRLPGMSGFDLVRRVRTAKLVLPVIMITAYSSSQGRKEATELGIYQYFQKPLDTDNVLTAVNKALFGDTVRPLSVPNSVAAAAEPLDVSSELRKRLETLRIDTGALQLMLAAIDGQVVHTVGNGPRLDHVKLATIVARNVSDSYLLAAEIGSRKPFTLQYHAGDKLELYCANIGDQYFLTLFFDATARRGRIGTIWVFTQRAIKDIVTMLPRNGEAGRRAPSSRPVQRQGPTAAPVPEPNKVAEPLPAEPEPEAEIELAPAENMPANITIIEEESEPEVLVGADEDFLDIGADELTALLAGGEVASSADVDLDAFWDDALVTTDGVDEASAGGLSVEEALARGLLSAEDKDGTPSDPLLE